MNLTTPAAPPAPHLTHINPPRWTRNPVKAERDRAWAIWCLAECQALGLAPSTVASVERTLIAKGLLSAQKVPTALL